MKHNNSPPEIGSSASDYQMNYNIDVVFGMSGMLIDKMIKRTIKY